jgi:hypothetical protein
MSSRRKAIIISVIRRNTLSGWPAISTTLPGPAFFSWRLRERTMVQAGLPCCRSASHP